MRLRKAVIVYFSPAGSTEHVAQVMARKIQSLEVPLTVINLAQEPDFPFIISQLVDAKDNICIYIGSPVYALHPASPVMDFLSLLPAAEKGYSVPFVTWGGVTSGIALHHMGNALQKKGYTVLGAAKVLAKHSLMWDVDSPFGQGHPDEQDDRLVEQLIEKVGTKLKDENSMGLSPSVLAYQSKEIHSQMEQRSFESAKAHFPQKHLRANLCSRCGLCEQHCPLEAITLSPYPEFGPACVCCFNCVRLCPEHAIAVDLSPLIARIRNRAEQFKEMPFTEIFV